MTTADATAHVTAGGRFVKSTTRHCVRITSVAVNSARTAMTAADAGPRNAAASVATMNEADTASLFPRSPEMRTPAPIAAIPRMTLRE